MQYIWVNGADEGQNKFIRVPPNNNPVTDVTSTDLTCNVNGLSGANVQTLSIPAGANVCIPCVSNSRRRIVMPFDRSPSNGTSTTSALARTLSPAGTKAPFKFTSPKPPRLPHHSTARVQCGRRFTPPACSMRNHSSGRRMSSTPITVSAGKYSGN